MVVYVKYDLVLTKDFSSVTIVSDRHGSTVVLPNF